MATKTKRTAKKEPERDVLGRKPFQVMLADNEKEFLIAATRQRGMTALSDFLRWSALQVARDGIRLTIEANFNSQLGKLS